MVAKKRGGGKAAGESCQTGPQPTPRPSIFLRAVLSPSSWGVDFFGFFFLLIIFILLYFCLELGRKRCFPGIRSFPAPPLGRGKGERELRSSAAKVGDLSHPQGWFLGTSLRMGGHTWGWGQASPCCDQAALGKSPSKQTKGAEGTIRDFRGGAAPGVSQLESL